MSKSNLNFNDDHDSARLNDALDNIRKTLSSNEIILQDNVLELTDVVESIAIKPSPMNFINKAVVNNSEPLINEMMMTETRNLINTFANLDFAKINKFERISNDELKNIVIDILKPELKKWLNENLSITVKSILEKEVQKVFRKELI